MDLRPMLRGRPQEQIRELLVASPKRIWKMKRRLRDYTYLQREEEHKLDGGAK